MSTPMVAMLLLGAVCWVFRIAFIVLVPAERLPARTQEALTYLAPSVLAALVAVELSGMTSAADVRGSALVLLTAVLVAAAVRMTGNLAFAMGVAAASVALIDLGVVA